MMNQTNKILPEGILLVDKPKGITSFGIVGKLRKIFNVKKIGHTGTLDPFATGVLVMLVGKKYTRLCDELIAHDKAYKATLMLGKSTDTFDCDGTVIKQSDIIPSEMQIKEALFKFQGEIEQIPPMFSAKKVKGKKLYELAREGKTIERKPSLVKVETTYISYNYPLLEIEVTCSKGTYIRSIAEDLGNLLGCGAHLIDLQRTRSGPFKIENCADGSTLHLQNDLSLKLLQEIPVG
ncbi:tRNA pseudouridine synthase B [Candidatus Rubidus massiliensis]|nr:tRNA pseudouridine synthase B [Candidatus Rubidus massiliensis]